jgi:hypothetical protein
MSEKNPHNHPIEAIPLSPEESAEFEARRIARGSEAPEHMTPEQVNELAEHVATIDALEEAVEAVKKTPDFTDLFKADLESYIREKRPEWTEEETQAAVTELMAKLDEISSQF